MQKTVVRIMAVILVLLMALSLMPIRTFADGECTHPNLTQDGWTVVTAASCTATGLKMQHCDDCDTDVEETISALGHDFSVPNGAKNATCTENGYSEYITCSRCNDIDPNHPKTPVDALGHDYSVPNDAIDPTCTEAGHSAFYTCSRCDDIDPERPKTTIAALGHNFTAETVAASYLKKSATCTHADEFYKSCTRCGASSEGTDEEDTFFNGQMLSHMPVYHQSTAATCLTAGNIGYYKCSECEQLFSDKACTKTITEEQIVIAAKHPEGHDWDAQGKCKNCNAKAYMLTVSYSGPGAVKVNGETAASNTSLPFTPQDEITVTFVPENGAVLQSVYFDGEAINVQNNQHVFTANGNGDTISAVFEKESGGSETPVKTVGFPKVNRNSNEGAEAAAKALVQRIAQSENLNVSDIKYTVYDIYPAWSDGALLTTDEIKALQTGITFTLDAPSGTTAADYNYRSYHYNGSSYDWLADSRTVTTKNFSPFLIIAVPIASSMPLVPGGPGTPPPPPADSLKPLIISVNHVVDNGSTEYGSITLSTNGRAIEWVKSDSVPGPSTTGSGLTGTTLGGRTSGGNYYFRYAASPSAPPSEWVGAYLQEYFTVTAVHKYGKGTYYVADQPNYKDNANVYKVAKGDTVEFHFSPSSHYWLYYINVNGSYVGQNNVKTTYYTPPIKTKTEVEFGFSSSSSSPKTADYSMVWQWSIIAAGMLMGMTGITWYLFRKKEF